MRSISIILVFVSMLMLTAQAIDVSTEVFVMDHMDSAQKQRLNMVMQDQVDYLSDLADRTLSIKSTKLVQDFSGNQYIVTECSPTGYMIYSIQSGVFVEYAPESQSPYEGYDGEVLYHDKETLGQKDLQICRFHFYCGCARPEQAVYLCAGHRCFVRNSGVLPVSAAGADPNRLFYRLGIEK